MTAADWTRKGFASKEPVLWRCPQCNVGLLLAPSVARTRKFCSRKCAASAQRAGTHPLPPGHSSDEGKKKSLENLSHDGSNATAFWQDREPVWLPCSECGQTYPTRATTAPLYCSGNCRQRAVNRQKCYAKPSVCFVCGTTFMNDKYRPRRTCGKSCARTLWWRERRAALGQQEENST